MAKKSNKRVITKKIATPLATLRILVNKNSEKKISFKKKHKTILTLEILKKIGIES